MKAISNYTEKAQVLKPEPTVKESLIVQEDYFFPAKTVNELARKKFQEKLLQEVNFDLPPCYGYVIWDKLIPGRLSTKKSLTDESNKILISCKGLPSIRIQ